jgi:ubiquitin-protein ligase E3 B
LQAISFLGNLCSIELLDFESFKLNVENFLIIATEIIDYCSNLLNEKSMTKFNESSSNNSTDKIITWTPLFGYLKIKFANSSSFGDLLGQLRFLWSHKFIMLLFFDSKITSTADVHITLTKANFKDYLKNIFEKTTFSSSQNQKHLLNGKESLTVYRICSFYKKILVLFSEPKIEILSALSFEEEFLLGLWKYFSSLGPQCGLKELVY